MAKFCTECGSTMPENSMFCTECGAKADPVPNPEPAPVFHPVPPSTPPQPAPFHAPTPQPVPQPAAPEPEAKAVSTGTFFGLMFLFALPVVGWILCLILAFAPKNKNLKHFARANLIWLLIGLILTALLAVAVNALINTVTPYVEQFINSNLGEFGSYEDWIGEFGSILEILKGLGIG